MIVVADRIHIEVWIQLREQVYSAIGREFHLQEIETWLTDPTRRCWIAFDQTEAVGFLEASLRNIVDGCLSSPVGYIEGITVLPSWQGRGIARTLVLTAEEWMREQGCSEMATDAEIDNLDAIAFHRRMGFKETYRIVEFAKDLTGGQWEGVTGAGCSHHN